MEFNCAIKKRPGKLRIIGDTIVWRAIGSQEKATIHLDTVQGLQATPPTAAKLRIKLTTKDGKATMFELPNPAEIENARTELQGAIKRFREQASGAQQPSEQSAPGEQSEAQQPTSQAAKPVNHQKPKNTGKSGKKLSLEPAKLLQNLDLQRQVLKANPDLMKTFQQVVIASNALTNEQFWSLRMQLLVTTAQELSQTTGSYNVLSTIKPITSGDNKVNINLTREKITDMFDQYPLVRKAYNECVPKINESEFWQRFFMSRLFLVLKGERVAQNHPSDLLLDPYIDLLHIIQQKQQEKRVKDNNAHAAPLFMNVETNSMNNPETYGNDLVTLGPKSTRNLIRSMNGLSHRLLVGKNKKYNEDEDAVNQPQMMTEELKLTDLDNNGRSDEGINLQVNLGDQLPDINAKEVNTQALVNQLPQSISLEQVGADLQALNNTEMRIQSLTPHPESINVTEAEMAMLNENVMLVHATTTEFLRQFWHFYSTDRAQAQQMREYLEKSLERIAAVGDTNQAALAAVTESVKHVLQMPL